MPESASAEPAGSGTASSCAKAPVAASSMPKSTELTPRASGAVCVRPPTALAAQSAKCDASAGLGVDTLPVTARPPTSTVRSVPRAGSRVRMATHMVRVSAQKAVPPGNTAPSKSSTNADTSTSCVTARPSTCAT